MLGGRGVGGATLGIDIGGTFTDVVLAGAGGTTTGKFLTTPDDPTAALLTGVSELLAQTGTPPAAVARVVHATTLATNVILERRGVPVAFVTTQGFGSMLSLGRGARVEEQRFDLFFAPGSPPVPRAHCVEVVERIGADGSVVVPFDEDSAAAAVARVRQLGVHAVAVCFLSSYANADHEERMAAMLRRALPEISVVTSSDVWPEIREYERATTTLMSAYVGPVMEGYLRDLRSRLAAVGIQAPVHIMGSNGGVMSVELAARRSVLTIESGPAAGVVSAQHVGARTGRPDVISFDMGGTTAKAGVIRGGRPDITHEFHVGGTGSFGGGREGTGVPIKAPAIDLAEVGAGGGSMAWVDEGGGLRVGPASAGADPGPACYGLGGDHPTVTDADLLLGYLDPAAFAGGTVPLEPARSEEAVRRHVADPLGIGVIEAAVAIHEIANANMAAAVDVVTVQRGVDPRRFALVALGGAGPMHVARIAERFEIDTVVIPVGTGVGSAMGLLTTDLRAERSRTDVMVEHDAALDRVAKIFDELTSGCADDLGLPRAELTVARAVDMRYRGQAHEVTVDAPAGEPDEGWLHRLVEAFARRYAERAGRTLTGPAELVSFRVVVTAAVGAPADAVIAPRAEAVRPSPAGVRPVYFAELGLHRPVPVYERQVLAPGAAFDGPAIVEERESTTVVPPGWSIGLDALGGLVLSRERREAAEVRP